MTLSEELVWRGFLNQTTFDDIRELDTKKPKFYMGFDASADSQAVGNLAALMFVKTFLRHGLEGYVVAGGSTSLIGDPGGKDTERPLQSAETIAYNVERAKEQIAKVLSGQQYKLVNNLDWTKDAKILPFLRDIGKHFSMTPLVQRDYIAQRLGQGGSGISYTEFSYTILQGYDYLQLFDTYGVTLQLGGSDQWGNCLSGVELIRRARGAESHVITMNLVINKTTGKKFGKSEAGAVWLDPAKTSVYQFYQFWLNADDLDVGDYLKIYTELDKPAVDGLMADFQKDKAGRLAQKTLAYEVTRTVHGQAAADAVKKITGVLFGDTDFSELDQADFAELEKEVPSAIFSGNLVEALVKTGLAGSNTEARRFIQDGAVYLNGQPVKADSGLHWPDGVKSAIIRRGKNGNAILKLK